MVPQAHQALKDRQAQVVLVVPQAQVVPQAKVIFIMEHQVQLLKFQVLVML